MMHSLKKKLSRKLSNLGSSHIELLFDNGLQDRSHTSGMTECIAEIAVQHNQLHQKTTSHSFEHGVRLELPVSGWRAKSTCSASRGRRNLGAADLHEEEVLKTNDCGS